MTKTEELFTDIVLNNKWLDEESPCGTGSTLSFTENLRKNFPMLLTKFNIQSMFDGPCGDFHWFQHVLKEPSLKDLKYIGGDIVKPMIENNIKHYAKPNISFIHIDLLTSKYPKVDLMMCRDCLFHLPFKDIQTLLQNFVDSNIPYFFATSHTYEGTIMVDIPIGAYRETNLFLPPINLPRNPLYIIDDYVLPHPPRSMILWSREQVSQSLLSDNT